MFDIGANTGQSAALFRRWFRNATIYSFEPVSEVFDQLQRWSRSVDGVHCLRVAIGSTTGTALINRHDITQLSSIPCSSGASGQETVPLMTLTSFVRHLRRKGA